MVASGGVAELVRGGRVAGVPKPQALLPDAFAELMGQLRAIAGVFGKQFAEAGEAVAA